MEPLGKSYTWLLVVLLFPIFMAFPLLSHFFFLFCFFGVWIAVSSLNGKFLLIPY